MKFILLLIIQVIFTVTLDAQHWEQLNAQFIELYNNDEYEKAIPVGEKTIIAAKKEFGALHQNYTVSLYNQGSAYLLLGEYKKAEPLFIEAKNIQQKTLGVKHPDYGATLNELGRLYAETKQYAKAEAFYVQAKNVRLIALGENHPEYGATLNDLATLYLQMKQYQKAEPLYLQSKNISEKTAGKSDPEYIATISNLAELYERMNLYEKAEMLYLEANEFYKKFPGDKDADYDASVDGLASLYDKMGQYTKAATYYLLSAEINKKQYGEISWQYAKVLNRLALIYTVMAEYGKAEQLYIQVAEIRKEVLGDGHPDYGTALNNLAAHYFDMGQYEKAESFFLQALEIVEQNPDKSNTDYLNLVNNMAMLYMQLGKYDLAEPLFFNLKEVKKKILGENDVSYATSLSNLANIYFKTGQYQKAVPLYTTALSIIKNIIGEQSAEYATSLQNLAHLYATMGLPAKAEPLYTRAVDIREKLSGKNHPDFATLLDNVAIFYLDRGENSNVEPLFVQAMNIRKQLFGEMHPDYAMSLNNLAFFYMDAARFDTAETYFKKAISIFEKNFGDKHPSYAVALNNLANLYMRTGQYQKAEPGLLKAAKIVLENILSTFSILSEAEKNKYLETNSGVFENNNSFLYQYKKASREMLMNTFNLQLALKSASLSDTKLMMEALNTSTDSSIRKLFLTWKDNKNLLAKQYSLPVANRRKDLGKIEEQTEAGEKELNLLSSEFRNQQAGLQISMKEVQNNLQQDEAAIEFVRFQLTNTNGADSVMYAAFVLKKNEPAPVFVPLCEEKQLQLLFDSAGKTATAMVNTFYRGLEIKNKNAASPGKELYRLIWLPLEPHLKEVKKISYSPAGKLFNIAFHALPVDSGHVLMDYYALQQYTSSRQIALRSIENKMAKPTAITLFGNASFTMDRLQLEKQKKGYPGYENVTTNIYAPQKRNSDNSSWSDLPGTAEEVKKIKQLFDQNSIKTSLLTQTKASEENLKVLSGNSPQILHIATHGFFLPGIDKNRKENIFKNENTYTLADDPLLRSGLVLAGANYAWSGKTPIEGVEDGIATAYEISQLNLSNTGLVVLSACETALGDVKGTEGVFGLQRAFKMAGVKKLIVSLWQVPDKETAELMTAFYSYWMKGKTINDAFAQAQADMRKKYSPFYWAAFVLVV